MTATSSFRRPAPLVMAGLALAALLIIIRSVLLWPEWTGNPDLSHGLFMPVVFLLLLHEARTRGTPRYLKPSRLAIAATTSLVIGGIGLILLGGIYSVALEWSNPLVGFLLSLGLVALLLAALLVCADARVRLVPLAWSAVAAILLWILVTPIPPGTYSRLTLSLQLSVTDWVLTSLHWLGIPATQTGNIIELSTTSVGVEEACSGVRSLLACIFAGFFFSATLVQHTWARILIIGLAAPLAIVMNFVRSLGLTLLANAGTDISGAWHDLSGFAILAGTAVVLGALAWVLGRGTNLVPTPAPAPAPAPSPPATWILLAGNSLTLLLMSFLMLYARPAAVAAGPAPDLEAILPTTFPGWEIRSDDMYRFATTLQTEHLAQRTFRRTGPDGIVQMTIYLAYWPAGQVPVSLVASHTPDACWPGAGWEPVALPEARTRLATANHVLDEAEHRLFESNGYPQHVWYWHLYDGRPIDQLDALSPRELLSLILRYGVRSQGSQLFVRISSNRPWDEIGPDPLVNEVVSRLSPLGL